MSGEMHGVRDHRPRAGSPVHAQTGAVPAAGSF
jgi:hypothetical protein